MVKINRSKRKKRPGAKTVLIVIGFAALVALIALSIISALSERKPDGEKVSYNEFISLLDEGKIEKAQVGNTGGQIYFTKKGNETRYRTDHPGTDDFRERLLLADVEMEEAEVDAFETVFSRLFGVLLTLLFTFMIGFFVFIIYDFFFKSESDNKKVKETSFSQIAGMKEIKDELLFLVKMMKDPPPNVTLPKGILLEGPPGNGKTMLAKALATEAGISFVAINGGELNSKYIGVTGKKIGNLFEEAEKCAPCILFIDEIDSLGGRRTANAGNAVDKETNSILNTLLSHLDGISGHSGVMVIAATNLSEALDPALLRHGRFDKRFYIPDPDAETRRELFELYIGKENPEIGISIDRLAAKTKGFSSADVAGTVLEAKLLAAKDGRKNPEEKDLDAAILEYRMKGKVRENTLSCEKEREVAACHEAGHAVAAYRKGKLVTCVSIRTTTSGAGGYTAFEGAEENDLPMSDDLFSELTVLLAGREAEIAKFGDVGKISLGSTEDVTRATELALSLVKVRQGIDYSLFGKQGCNMMMQYTKELLEKAQNEAKGIIEENKELIGIIEKELIEKQTIDGKRFSGLASENAVLPRE